MEAKKLPIMECTVPAGNDCLVPSKMEATAIFSLNRIPWNSIKLLTVKTSVDESFLAWCAMKDKQNINAIQPMFSVSEHIKGIPQTAKECRINEYILYNNIYYIICRDPLYQMLIRQLTCFAEQEHIEAVTALSGKKSIQPPDFYLVKITPVDQPRKVLSVSWLVVAETETELSYRFFPVFWEDKYALRNYNLNSLNWIYLDENDTFVHNHLVYQVHYDKNNKLYISNFVFGRPNK